MTSSPEATFEQAAVEQASAEKAATVVLHLTNPGVGDSTFIKKHDAFIAFVGTLPESAVVKTWFIRKAICGGYLYEVTLRASDKDDMKSLEAFSEEQGFRVGRFEDSAKGQEVDLNWSQSEKELF